MENLLKAAWRLYKFRDSLEEKEMARLLSVSVKTVSNYVRTYLNSP
jgi:DNA-binding NarL/FixJ family response regulator